MTIAPDPDAGPIIVNIVCGECERQVAYVQPQSAFGGELPRDTPTLTRQTNEVGHARTPVTDSVTERPAWCERHGYRIIDADELRAVVAGSREGTSPATLRLRKA